MKKAVKVKESKFKVGDQVRLTANYEFYPEIEEFKNTNNNIHVVTDVDQYGRCTLDNNLMGTFYLDLEKI